MLEDGDEIIFLIETYIFDLRIIYDYLPST